MSPSEDRSASTRHVIIREFEPGDEACFRKLNEEWITRYFSMEAKDEEALVDPQSRILAPGGRIFLATIEDHCIGCCALLRLCADEFEVAKMAVAPMWQGSGIGRKLLQTVLEAARSAGARRLYLETNHILTPAIRLYHSIGFKPIPPSRIVPSPYARADVYMEMILA
ncbi:MAG TPA: GNAT family N-acetyltransferase [Bryobacteraceae bacterium]|nr:GNAT family N-acetyltransferase [Bryobacteraceae bacterium]